MPTLTYPAVIDEPAPGEFLVTFPDVPEAITGGATLEEALDQAIDALDGALEGYLLAGLPLPRPRPAQAGEVDVPLPLAIAARAAVAAEMARQSLSGRALAERMGKNERHVRRILGGQASFDQSLLALRTLGVRPALALPDAA